MGALFPLMAFGVTIKMNAAFLVDMRDHFGDAERGTSVYTGFLNAIVATSRKAFEDDIVVESRDVTIVHQERYNVNSAISHNVDYLTNCHQAQDFLSTGYSSFLRI